MKRSYWSLTLAGVLCWSLLTALSAGKTNAQETRKAGETRTDEMGIEQVWVPAGCFMMGSVDPEGFAGQTPPFWGVKEKAYEMPAHEVCLSAGYWIDKYEVTNAAFQAFVNAGSYEKQELWSEDGWTWLKRQAALKIKMPLSCVNEAKPDDPRACVSWFEAEAYAKWRGGQLPTEAQWEFAARGPDANIYPWGNEWDASKTNVVDSKAAVTVGSYPDGVSWVGAHDMAGNLMEWVNDWLDPKYYAEMVRDDPQGPEKGTVKVEKGGWWGSNSFAARSAYKHFEDPPTYADHHIGFRIVTLDDASQ